MERVTSTSGSPIALSGDIILGDDKSIFTTAKYERYLRGYNTHTIPSSQGSSVIAASVCGVVEMTETVVSVTPMTPRYMPEVGDVVVGRVIDVMGNRWRVDVYGMQDAIMMISNVTEPGGVLRRRGRADELTMRSIFKEDDVLVAEVQKVSNDGGISLHTRSAAKYGKKDGIGQFIQVRPAYVPRVKHQFHVFVDPKRSFGPLALPSTDDIDNIHHGGGGKRLRTEKGQSLLAQVDSGVLAIFGVNGGIWIGAATQSQIAERRQERELEKLRDGIDGDNSTNTINGGKGAVPLISDEDLHKLQQKADSTDEVIANQHRCVALVINIIRGLDSKHLLITPEAVECALEHVFLSGISAFEVLSEGNRDRDSNISNSPHGC